MEVAIPGQSMDFEFNRPRSPRYLSAPATPRGFGDYYISAPTSPSQLSQLYHEFNDFLVLGNSRSAGAGGEGSSFAGVPFDWEEKPGTPKSPKGKYQDDFAFDVSGELEKTTSLSAEELFDGGVIRPLKPPPRLQMVDELFPQKSPTMSPRSHRRPSQRGRERESPLSSSRSGRRGMTRSLSPLRVSQYPWEEERQQQQQQSTKQLITCTSPKPPLHTSTVLTSSSSKGSRKWRLKDFFLFRSASEGRAADKDPLKKYTAVCRRYDMKQFSSFNSTGSPGSSGSSSRRRGPVSAHELHYTMNRAVSEDLKKKTFLPYKQGILGRLAFNPAVHAIANGFGFSRE